MTIPTHPRRRDAGKKFTCKACGGPCRSHKGSVHGWTCTVCIDAYLDRQEQRRAG